MAEVLVSLAERTGFDAEEVRDFLATNDGVIADELRAGAAGIRSVPTIRVGGVPVSVHNRFRYSLKCFDMPPATQPPKPPSESPPR